MKYRNLLHLITIISLILTLGMLSPPAFSSPEETADKIPVSPETTIGIQGPFVIESVAPYVFNGDLRDLPQLRDKPVAPRGEIPIGSIPRWPEPAGVTWEDPVAQTQQGGGRMPDPLIEFEGLNKAQGGGWTPPDTCGEVGPNHYIQGVNIAFGIYDKATGTELVAMSFDDLFDGTGTPCDDQNRGDIIVLYDPMADRWLLSDFSLPSSGPVYECIAVSQSADPVSGGWYFYALVTDDDGSPWHDYPKLGVWPDAYYMSANMFDPPSAAWVWAMDRTAMLSGITMTAVLFTDIGYWSLLPASLRGPEPPTGTPNYFATVDFPDQFRIWEFHVDWTDPGSSTFTGPINITVPEFGIISDIPQRPPGADLDALSDRPMMQLQYRDFGSHDSLWVNHTVASGGVAGVRWYEVRDPGGTPTLHQAGTYQPDDGLYRWMGSLAVDQDGNMAVGYSVSSGSTEPGIRYAGRLAGESPGMLPQGEAELYQGSGVQTGSNRWGDYSSMSIDPVDDCTFWYTTEYHDTDGSNWQTRIGSFRFPSCGQPKGWITGQVYDADTLAGIPGVLVIAEEVSTTMTVETDANGHYTLILTGDSYTLTAGPLMPAYPDPSVVPGVVVTATMTTTQDFYLTPYPYLIEDAVWIDDNVPGGNGNGYPEPGESGILLWESISNTGVTTATNVTAQLVALTPGVTVTVANTNYPDIAADASETNLTAFEFSIAPTVPCGARLDFGKIITADQSVWTVSFSLYAKIPLPRESFLSDDMESGEGNWTTGGSPNTWAITEEYANSPTHAWSDSPGGDYADNTSNWLRAPIFDLSGMTEIALGFWTRYEIEASWDFGYLEYSLDGGSSWEPALADYTGFQYSWREDTFDLPALDDQSNVTFRFRFESDSYVTEDGWYIDDVDLSYEPFECSYAVGVPTLLSPTNGSLTSSHAITLTWEAGLGAIPDGYNLELDGVIITTTASYSLAMLDVGVHTWRVRAFNPVGPSTYSDMWTVEVMDLPSVPVLLAPPDGTLTSNHDITFTWEPSAGGPPEGYDLELDGAVTTLTDTTWMVSLTSGLHSWRVRAFNAVGSSDYAITWTVEIMDPPGVPVLLTPIDGILTSSHTITFTWEPTAGGPPEGYDLELDGAVTTLTDTTWMVSLTSGLHSWRVRAFNAVGSSDYAITWTVEIMDPPGVPVLLTPIDGILTSNHTITFTWEPTAGGPVEGYDLELDGALTTLTDTTWMVSLTSGLHSWRVRAFNAVGSSDYAITWTVEIMDPPGVPSLQSPANGTLTSNHNITFAWTAGPGGPPEGYDLELDGAVTTLTDTTWMVSLTSGLHSWRVRTFNPVGSSDYAITWTVEIMDPPGVPTLLTPIDGILTSSHTITFTWEPTAGGPVEGYELELDGTVTTLTDTSWTVSLTSVLHTWRVRAINPVAYSDYAVTATVEIMDPPGVPTLLAPADGTVTGNNEITFTWAAGTGGPVEGYNIEIDGTIITTTDPTAVTSLTAGLHSWRVRAINPVGTSNYSQQWTVTIGYWVYLPLVMNAGTSGR